MFKSHDKQIQLQRRSAARTAWVLGLLSFLIGASFIISFWFRATTCCWWES